MDSPLQTTEEWNRLLREFARAESHSSDDRGEAAGLLSGFVEAENKSIAAEGAEVTHELPELSALIRGYTSAFQSWRKSQESFADDFNLIELLGLTADENRHSDVIAWLVDSNPYTATHSQGSLGFRILCRHLSLPESYADVSYSVRREVSGEESRVDVEITSFRNFIIHIESKIRTKEGWKQTEREWRDLTLRAKRELVEPANVHAFFLTRDGSVPKCSNFRPLKWKTVARVFEEFAENSKAPSVQWFAMHYAEAISKFIARPDERKKDNGTENIQ